MKIRALVKKIIPIVDNLTATEKKRLQQIKQIQKLHQSGVSIREITKQLQINRHTVRKYLNENQKYFVVPTNVVHLTSIKVL